MEIVTRKMDAQCTMHLSEKEVMMLHHLFGWSASYIAEAITGKVTGEPFSKEDWEQFGRSMRAATEMTVTRMRDARKVFLSIEPLTSVELDRIGRVGH